MSASLSSACPGLEASTPGPPLCVDLDGTLVRTDTAWETILRLLRNRPLLLLKMPAWSRRGKHHLKGQIARRTNIDVAHLPYRHEVLSLVAAARAAGRPVVLVTGAHGQVARAVARHLKLFDHVIATSDTANLRGQAKLDAIRAHLGTEPFDYIADDASELPALRAARQAYLVNPSPSLERQLAHDGSGKVATVWRDRSSAATIRALVEEMRPQQWLKNALLAVPVLVGQHLLEVGVGWRLTLAIAAFCLASSGVYILNDLLDLPADRRHPIKRHRPFAEGRAPLLAGLIASPVLMLVGLLLALAVSLPLAGIVVGYLVVTLGYSLALKAKAIIDVLVLSGLYSLRLVAGGVAAEVQISPWLLALTGFLFLSLATVKRYTELVHIKHKGQARAPGRGYLVRDLPLLLNMGIASGYLSVLVFALYINSRAATGQYGEPALLWLIPPMLIYWLSRLWFLAHRGVLSDDPVAFALHDGMSYVVGAGIVVTSILAQTL